MDPRQTARVQRLVTTLTKPVIGTRCNTSLVPRIVPCHEAGRSSRQPFIAGMAREATGRSSLVYVVPSASTRGDSFVAISKTHFLAGMVVGALFLVASACQTSSRVSSQPNPAPCTEDLDCKPYPGTRCVVEKTECEGGGTCASRHCIPVPPSERSLLRRLLPGRELLHPVEPLHRVREAVDQELGGHDRHELRGERDIGEAPPVSEDRRA